MLSFSFYWFLQNALYAGGVFWILGAHDFTDIKKALRDPMTTLVISRLLDIPEFVNILKSPTPPASADIAAALAKAGALTMAKIFESAPSSGAPQPEKPTQ